MPCDLDCRNSTSKPVFPSSQVHANQKTIGVCIVIVEELYHERIWRYLCEQSSDYNLRLFIHAKHPEGVRSHWVKSRLVESELLPEWNSVEVLRAMLLLLSRAVEDTSVGRVLFATESCVPVCSLQAMGDALFAEDVSWLACRHKAQNLWEQAACFQSVDSAYIPPQVNPIHE
jgi:hypothetical protein